MNVVGFAGFSGSGKTTLVEQVIMALKQHGLRVSVVKHAHHNFDIDQPGKDTFRHRSAGAFEVVVASKQRLALFTTPTVSFCAPCSKGWAVKSPIWASCPTNLTPPNPLWLRHRKRMT